MRWFRVLWCSCLVLVTGALAGTSGATPARALWTPAEALIADPLPLRARLGDPAVAWGAGELAVLYQNPQGRITFRRGGEVQTLDDEAPDPGGSAVQLHSSGNHLYALWFDKTPTGKRLYLRASADGGQRFGPLVTVNSAGGVVPEYVVATDGGQRVAIAYTDERVPLRGVFANRSEDGGRTWLNPDVRLDGPPAASPQDNADRPSKDSPEAFAYAPRLVFQGNRLIALWRESTKSVQGPVALLMSRYSDDGGQTWAPAVPVYRGLRETPTEALLLSHQNQLYAVAALQEKGLLAFRSTDGGQSWSALGVAPGTAPGADQNAAKLGAIGAVTSGDQLLVAYNLEPREGKAQVYVAALSVATGQWQPEPWRLDRKKPNPDRTKAGYVTLATLPGGGVVAVWEDYRYILPAIFLDYSADGGVHWLDEPVPLTEPGAFQARNPGLVMADDRVLVTFDREEKRAGKDSRTVLIQSLPYDRERGLTLKAAPLKRLASAEEDSKRVKLRAEAFWNLRAEGKYAETYAYFDPVYRSGVTLEGFLRGQGKMIFSEPKVGEPKVDGIFAKLPVTVSYTLTTQPLGFVVIEPAPPQESTFDTEWIWFDDDWYLAPPAVTGKSHLNY